MTAPQSISEAEAAVRSLCTQLCVPPSAEAMLLDARGAKVRNQVGSQQRKQHLLATVRQLRALRATTVDVLRTLRLRESLRAAVGASGGSPDTAARLIELIECERHLEQYLLPEWSAFVPSMPFVYGGQVFPLQLHADRQKLVAGLASGCGDGGSRRDADGDGVNGVPVPLPNG